MDGLIKVMMVDDEADFCTVLKENLESTGGFEVVFTTNPLEAEDLARRECPQVILLDNVMPQRKGADIVRALKAMEETRRIPVIMVSGRGEMVYNKKADSFKWLPNTSLVKNRGEIPESKNPEALASVYGVVEYVSKPVATDVLIDVIKEVVSKNQKGPAPSAPVE